MKKVVLVWPPNNFGIKKAYSMPSLGLLYLSSSLRTHGYSPEVLDLGFFGYSLDVCVEKILATQPDYVGISVMTDRLYASLLIAQKIKTLRPDIQVLFGGPHINATGDDVMNNLELGVHVDACLMNESEETLPAFLNGDSPPGLIYRASSGVVIQNPAVIPDSDLDNLAFPDLRDISNVPAYYTPFFKKGPMTTMMATRGCLMRAHSVMSQQTWGKNIVTVLRKTLSKKFVSINEPKVLTMFYSKIVFLIYAKMTR